MRRENLAVAVMADQRALLKVFEPAPILRKAEVVGFYSDGLHHLVTLCLRLRRTHVHAILLEIGRDSACGAQETDAAILGHVGRLGLPMLTTFDQCRVAV